MGVAGAWRTGGAFAAAVALAAGYVQVFSRKDEAWVEPEMIAMAIS